MKNSRREILAETSNIDEKCFLVVNLICREPNEVWFDSVDVCKRRWVWKTFYICKVLSNLGIVIKSKPSFLFQNANIRILEIKSEDSHDILRQENFKNQRVIYSRTGDSLIYYIST